MAAPSYLSGSQALGNSYDPELNAIRTVSNVTAVVSGEQQVSIDSADDSIAIGDASGNLATTTQDGAKRGLDVNVLETTKNQILAANDLSESFAYTNVGGSYRLDSVSYTSATVGHTATKTFTWADFGTSTQRVTSIVWSVV